VGFWEVEFVPSPKPQVREVGELVDVSVNWTERGATPEVGVAVKAATGGAEEPVNQTFTRKSRSSWLRVPPR
jgi:hypothetical protein